MSSRRALINFSTSVMLDAELLLAALAKLSKSSLSAVMAELA
jgi:hypothetical protein